MENTATYLEKQSLALKVIKINKYGQKEYKNMLQLQQVNPDHCNLVRLIEHFQIKNAHCLVYEKLDQSMSDFMRANKLRRLQLSEIRAIAQQMLVSLQTLESLKIVHSDIKPDNIMLVNQKSHPFKVKLIDFGLALKKSKMRTGLNLQNERYRAFEVIMGLPLDGGVDMWGLACCLAYFYIGKHLFDGDNIRDHLGKLLSFMGEPDDDLIQSAFFKEKFFKKLETDSRKTWVFKQNSGLISSKKFISLLKEMLQMDKEKRIKPSEALNHNFITMNHLSEFRKTTYVRKAEKIMDPFKPQSKEVSSLKRSPLSYTDKTRSSDEKLHSLDKSCGTNEANSRKSYIALSESVLDKKPSSSFLCDGTQKVHLKRDCSRPRTPPPARGGAPKSPRTGRVE
uniref:Protein kinase domain-containing protein n=1 Tax=Nothobranchius furzeri TaxID=105023 RepID=A0A8C6KSX3_NOTFU